LYFDDNDDHDDDRDNNENNILTDNDYGERTMAMTTAKKKGQAKLQWHAVAADIDECQPTTRQDYMTTGNVTTTNNNNKPTINQQATRSQ